MFAEFLLRSDARLAVCYATVLQDFSAIAIRHVTEANISDTGVQTPLPLQIEERFTEYPRHAIDLAKEVRTAKPVPRACKLCSPMPPIRVGFSGASETIPGTPLSWPKRFAAPP